MPPFKLDGTTESDILKYQLGEVTMRKATISITVATLVLASAALTGPAAATKASTVLSACVSRGTQCTATTEGGGNKYCFDNSSSGQGTQCVKCPAVTDTKTDCAMAARIGGGRKGTTVDGVIKAPAQKSVR